MVRKKLDERIRTLIELSIVNHHRSMLILIGDYGKDQIPNIYQLLSKCTLNTVTSTSSSHNSTAITTGSSSNGRPKVLWCYKKELGFSTHRLKRMKKLKRDKARGLIGNNNADGSNSTSAAENFELFISQTDIEWCYYKDTHRILGSTVGMLILQDFEAITPNVLARTIETVQGGGMVIFLFRTVKSLRQLYAVTMDVHARYRTESSYDIIPRFNERFILSLHQCTACLVCDDELNILPISRKSLLQLSKKTIHKNDNGEIILDHNDNNDNNNISEYQQLYELQQSLIDTPHIGVLIELTRTLDQAKAVLTFLEACSEQRNSTGKSSSTIAMTASRGRGKSAAIGLCLAGAISFGYSTIYVTAPTPENLISVFDFIVRGLKALQYQQHMDYTIHYNNAYGRDVTKCILSIVVHRNHHRQIIQYISPEFTDKFSTAEIIAIDEAAAIPLPIVRAIVSPQQQSNKDGGIAQPSNQRLTFLSSTVNGYEGTGRALSLKLLHELRERNNRNNMSSMVNSDDVNLNKKKGEKILHEQKYAAAAAMAATASTNSNDKIFGPFREIELTTPIRYTQNDPIELWLHQLLCLDSGSSTASSSLKLRGGTPAPKDCELYSVNRDALFSYHKLSEAFLQKIMGLYTSAHYKNTPNDLQMLSDAPAHSIFVLLSPSAEQDSNSLPDVLVVIQVALEGKVSRKVIEAQLARGHRSAGDLIPWTISQQFGDSQFASLSGARIVRIAVHPSVQGMGYGSRAIELLYHYYNGDMIPLQRANNIENSDEGESDNEDSNGDESDKNDDDDGDEFTGDGIRGERLKPRKELPPLLLPLTEVKTPRLDWIGTSFGLTLQLHQFWSRCWMRLLYLRQTKNDLTGEHSAIMVRALPQRTDVDDKWLSSFLCDTRRRIVTLLGGSFRELDIRLALATLENLDNGEQFSSKNRPTSVDSKISSYELELHLSPHDRKRLELYGRNLCDHHLITDLFPILARLHFLGRFGSEMTVSSVQAALLVGVGLQGKTVDDISKELGLPTNQVLAMFNKTVRKFSIAINAIVEAEEKKAMLADVKDIQTKTEKVMDNMKDVAPTTLADDAKAAADEVRKEARKANALALLPPEIAADKELMSYVVKGTPEQWDSALSGQADSSKLGSVQILSTREKRKPLDISDIETKNSNKLGSNQGGSKGSKKKKIKQKAER